VALASSVSIKNIRQLGDSKNEVDRHISVRILCAKSANLAGFGEKTKKAPRL
jgi:hypothetical protein